MAFKKFNIYDGVRVSEKVLSFSIIAGLGALAILMIVGSRAGFTVNFNTGDRIIAEQHLRYGDTVKEPAMPTKEGYVFDGWYADSDRTVKYDFENKTLRDDITIYGAWHKSDTAVNAEINEEKGADENE